MIYTIGHSNMTQKSFVDILKSFKIDIVVDVRSSPYSKFVSHFNREDIKRSLIENGMRYIFLGDYIGGKPRDKKYYENGEVNYRLIAQSDRYIEGINRIIELNNENNIVLMCSEEDPYNCHRHNLITQTLVKKGLEVTHIRKNSKIDKITNLDKKDIQTTLF
ncbi:MULTISPECIES: DUF488 family protein [Methanobacterium]|uniref:DUF488 domain-containing protein n=1 Tax=Methanobacterium veterum TaxID=408577 RepID=A0A9E5A286_9EURY|nr:MULTISPECIES: DUF488 domain-containing protein [Methanobacterium]MCZ3366510.1 DUF488 domain-containing protein [Methanobacterium veterum]MCZ3371781.1 DUF488 domain-containing protein [Methanobacterium veterum]